MSIGSKSGRRLKLKIFKKRMLNAVELCPLRFYSEERLKEGRKITLHSSVVRVDDLELEPEARWSDDVRHKQFLLAESILQTS